MVDLPALRRACGPLIACYERFLADGSLDVGELDDALASLRVLPVFEGRLGRAVALVIAGGDGAPSEDTVAALELLRTTTGLRPAPAASKKSKRREAKKGCGEIHPPLPGLE